MPRPLREAGRSVAVVVELVGAFHRHVAAGGLLGGISTGQPIVARFAVKPTSSILKPVETIDKQGNNTDIITKGRHDPCVGIRAVPVGEAMLACVLADHLLLYRAYEKSKC